MKKKEKDKLMDQLTDYGYPLMRPQVTAKPEEVLKALLRQKDARLLEGFPVVFLNMLREHEKLAWENEAWKPSRELPDSHQYRLTYLLSLTYLVFELFGLDRKFKERTMKLLGKFKKGTETLARLDEPFRKSQDVRVDQLRLSVERLKNSFQNYAVRTPENEEVQKKKHALTLELLLSELFTPRQKELLKKRLEGKPLTKTEKEYFYRVVKKRLKALANDELHRMARELVS